MAKGKKEQLRVALVLDLDEYQKGLNKAEATAKAEGTAVGKSLGDAVDKAFLKYFTLDKAIELSKKSLQGFARTAQQMEKEGRGNEGTAAFVALTTALSKFGQAVVRTVASTNAFKAAVSGLADVANFAAGIFEAWNGEASLASGVLLKLSGEAKKFVGFWQDAVTNFMTGNYYFDDFDAEKNKSALTKAGEMDVSLGNELIAKDAIDRQKKDFETRARERAEQARKVADEIAEKAKTDAEARAIAFRTQTRDILDGFVASWDHGFAEAGTLFRNFSVEIASGFEDMKTSTVSAVGDVFAAIAFTGPLLEKAFGQSARAARAFQIVQMSLVGAKAAVMAVMTAGEGWDLLGGDPATGKKSDPAGAAIKFVASGVYASAAALAGVAAAQAARGGGSGGSGGADRSGITDAENFERRRRTVIISIENAYGKEGFVREVLMPEINRAVDDDVELRSTHSQSTDRVDTGRYGA